MRPVGQAQRMRPFCLFEFFRENPVLVPKEVPEGEEARADELPQVRRQTGLLQAGYNQVVDDEVGDGDDGVAEVDLGAVALQLPIIKYPETLQGVIYYPANNIGAEFGPPQVPVQSFIGQEEYEITAPKIGTAAD